MCILLSGVCRSTKKRNTNGFLEILLQIPSSASILVKYKNENRKSSAGRSQMQEFYIGT